MNWKKYENTGDRSLIRIGADPSILLVLADLAYQTGNSILKILDIGCGEASFFYDYIFGKNIGKQISYTGIDISKISLRNRIMSLILRNFQILQSDAEQIFPFQDQSFDLLFSRMVLHNFSDLGTHFSESCRVLKIGGNYIVVTLTSEYISKKMGRQFQEGEAFDYPLGKAGISFKYYFRTRQSIIEFAQKNGLKEVGGEYFYLGNTEKTIFSTPLQQYPRVKKVTPFDIYIFKKE